MAIDTNVAVADLEPAFLDPKARDRADIKITKLQKSTDFYGDVTAARPDSVSFIAYSKQKPGLVAQRIEKKKLSDTHYARHAKSEGLKFYPMGVEDSGAFGMVSKKFSRFYIVKGKRILLIKKALGSCIERRGKNFLVSIPLIRL